LLYWGSFLFDEFLIMKPLTLGLTMRVTAINKGREKMDSLAHDWFHYLKSVFHDVRVVPLPNIEDDITPYLADLGLNGIIVTGGNAIGDEPARDTTENRILDHALEHKLPVLGVCRGIQVLTHRSSGKVVRRPEADHVGTVHTITMHENPFGYPVGLQQVNSYHENFITECGQMTPFAHDQDGNVEAVYHAENNWLGLMWHPERPNPFRDHDDRIIADFFSAT